MRRPNWRYGLVLLAGLAIGFDAGWLAFDSPFHRTTAHDVQVAVLKAGHGAYLNARCHQREFPTDTWDCEMATTVNIPVRATARVHDGKITVGPTRWP